jgi:thiol-disulfide isomerase/thioredoxin
MLRRTVRVLVFSLWTVAWSGGAESVRAATPDGMLTLPTGDKLPGTILPAPQAGLLRWQGSDFAAPFDFPIPAVGTAQFPALQPAPKLSGEFALECRNGDLLTGRIVGWTDAAIELDSVHFGRIHVAPQAVRRLYRLNDNPTIVFPALTGLLDWRSNQKKWREDGTQIESSEDQAIITGDFNLPEAAVVEFEISWTGQPAFVFALGVDPSSDADKPQDGWRFEIWGNELTIVREQELKADVDRVQTLAPNIKRTQLVAYINQATGSLHVFEPGGKPAGSVVVPSEATRSRGEGIRLINRRGHVRLESLRITRWNGVLPNETAAENAQCQLADGTAVAGTVSGLSEDGAAFVVKHNGADKSVPVTQLLSAELSSGAVERGGPAAVILQDGTRISGALDARENDRLVVTNSTFQEPLPVNYDELRSVMVLQTPGEGARADGDVRLGRLEIGELRLRGSLAPSEETPTTHCLAFRPAGALTTSPLSPNVAGRIVYREASRGAQQPLTKVSEPQAGRNFADIFLKKSKETGPAKLPSAHNLYLRSGDVIPCTVTLIDESGVSITSSVATASLVPHEKIKAVELIPGSKPPDLVEAKKSRLLTLPRLQKLSPPTQLLCSKTGDFLRGRLVAMTPDKLVMEVQLDEYEVPRDRVSQIIWLHADELPPTAGAGANADAGVEGEVVVDAPAAEAQPPAAAEQRPLGHGLVQAIESNGNRITFDPAALNGQSLSGHSDVLGEVKVDVGTIDELVFGSQIALAVTGLPYQDWRLTPAVEPLFTQETDTDGTAEGEVSPLVGKVAPEINLDLLAGGKFRLSENRGKIVLLDFWASWCGPCMQTMPLVEAAIQEFDPAKVRLVSVNLEEPADHIRGVLERHEMEVEVALDIDGVAARKYEANAIPQLVIVDPQGKISRLYIGGGPQVVEQIKAALTEMLSPPSAEPPATEPPPAS